jgi:hypothetical protein
MITKSKHRRVARSPVWACLLSSLLLHLVFVLLLPTPDPPPQDHISPYIPIRRIDGHTPFRAVPSLSPDREAREYSSPYRPREIVKIPAKTSWLNRESLIDPDLVSLVQSLPGGHIELYQGGLEVVYLPEDSGIPLEDYSLPFERENYGEKRPCESMDDLHPAALDALRHNRTVVLIEPTTGKLRKAYVHLPATIGDRAYGLEMQMKALKRGTRLPSALPIEYRIQYFRHPLHLSEMKAYPVLFLHFIEIESSDALVQYLIDGGAILGGDFQFLYSELYQQVNERVQQVELDIDHPLFRAYYDITEYSAGGISWDLLDESEEFPGGQREICPPVGPVPALELDGRVVVLSNVSYDNNRPCIANRLYINAMAFLLIQPSLIEGRYTVVGGGRE